MRTNHAGIGGPNIAPPGDGVIADCVANAPGGPVHVLLSDEVAEHIPGCNMAFRREQLMAIGGFDPRFRVAGDDVDLCWRLQERGWTLGFAPTAVVWHHRRNSITAYLKQQYSYAKAEALLAEKWPGKYNGVGHVMWQGRLYGKGVVDLFFQRCQDLSWEVGQRSVSIDLRAQRRSLAINDAYAGVVLLADVCRLSDRAWGIMDAAAVAGPTAGCWNPAHTNPGGPRRRSSAVSPRAWLKLSPFCFAVPRRLASPSPACRASARASSPRNGTMELEGPNPQDPTALRYFAVERALGNGRIAFIPA